MGISDALQLGAQFGPLGVLVFFLMWRESRNDKWREKHEQDRLEADKAETSSREKLASALTALTMVVQGRGHV